MSLLNIEGLTAKYKIFRYDAGYKGFTRAFFETFSEFLNKRKFRKIGVIHPDLSENIEHTIAKSCNKDAHENQPSSFYMLNKVFKHIPLKNSDITLLDIGCGAGRVMTFGMLLKFKKVMGIDLDEEGIKKAESNCSKMQDTGYKTGFDVHTADACTFKIPTDVNVIYLFNPFGEKTMNKVIHNIITHVNKEGSVVFVIYSNPVSKALFKKHANISMIYESYFKNSKTADVAIFNIEPEHPAVKDS